jgi:hypothetical protein
LPLIDVSYDQTLSDAAVGRLGELLPAIVSEAVDCAEEPWVGPPAEGDFEIRFRNKGPLDVGELNCVVEVRTKLFPSRQEDKQRRAELIRDRITSSLDLEKLGVWLILSDGAWSQT